MSILVRSDWDLYPTAIPDYSTKNTTFLSLAALYKKMGVKNHNFMLALLQPELQDVDPFAEDLTPELKEKIILECRFNPWYFFREILRFPPQSGQTPVHFRANRGNISMLWCMFSGVDYILIQPRQTGKSVSSDGLSIWVQYIGSSSAISTLLTKDATLRTQNIERLKRIRDYLPPYINSHQPGIDADNQHELTCNMLGNRYITGVSQKTEAGANKLGRGSTTPYIHFDEPPFMDNLDITAPAAMAAMGAAREEARENNQFNGVIFTTTAGEKDTRSGRYFYDMMTGGTGWDEAFLDVESTDKIQRIVDKGCKGPKPVMVGVFNHRQLGYTDEWLYKRIREAGASGEAADRDFFNRWTSGSDKSPLTREQNNTIKESEKDAGWVEITDNDYVVRWFYDEHEIKRRAAKNKFIMGLDGSEAVGQDNIGVVIIDITDLSVVGTVSCNETNLIRFSQFIGDLLVRYKNTLFMPEKKSTGQTIVDALLIILHQAGEDPFQRIYNRIVENRETMRREYAEITIPMSRRTDQLYDRYKKYFGFNTSAKSRDQLYGKVLQNAAKRGGTKVFDNQLINELLGLTIRNGRIDHGKDGNDDMVIAWLLAHWTIIYGKNLDFYGIDVTSVATEAALGASNMSAEDRFEVERQKMIRKRMDAIYSELAEMDDDVAILRAERELVALGQQYNPSSDESFSIDGLMRKAKEQREHSRMKSHSVQHGPIRLNWR